MTHATSTAAPPWAVTCWSDDYAIYIELPVKGGPPYVASFPHTEGGLSKALYTMRSLYQKLGVERVGKAQVLDTSWPHPKIVGPKPSGTDAERESARAALKKLGIFD